MSIAKSLDEDGSTFPVQAFFSSSVGSLENEKFCMLGYYFDQGQFYTANELTSQYLTTAGIKGDLHNKNLCDDCQFVGQFNMIPLKTSPEIQLMTSSGTLANSKLSPLRITIGKNTRCAKNWFNNVPVRPDGKNAIQTELCAYQYFVNQQLETVGCFKFRSPSADPEVLQCQKDWGTCVMKCGKLPKGTAFGHVPDTCAGGNPFPEGCWLPQFGSCNSSIGSGQCTPMRIANCVEYNSVQVQIEHPNPPHNVIILKCDSILDFTWKPDGPAGPCWICRDRLENDMNRRKRAWRDWVMSLDPGCVPVCLSRYLDKKEKTFCEYLSCQPTDEDLPVNPDMPEVHPLPVKVQASNVTTLSEIHTVVGTGSGIDEEDADLAAFEDAVAQLETIRIEVAAANFVPVEMIKFCLTKNERSETYGSTIESGKTRFSSGDTVLVTDWTFVAKPQIVVPIEDEIDLDEIDDDIVFGDN